jgi:hypothetical protein
MTALCGRWWVHGSLFFYKKKYIYIYRLVKMGLPTIAHYLLAPHTSGPRDVPRCGALSLLQKTPHYRGVQQKPLLG